MLAFRFHFVCILLTFRLLSVCVVSVSIVFVLHVHLCCLPVCVDVNSVLDLAMIALTTLFNIQKKKIVNAVWDRVDMHGGLRV